MQQPRQTAIVLLPVADDTFVYTFVVYESAKTFSVITAIDHLGRYK